MLQHPQPNKIPESLTREIPVQVHLKPFTIVLKTNHVKV